MYGNSPAPVAQHRVRSILAMAASTFILCFSTQVHAGRIVRVYEAAVASAESAAALEDAIRQVLVRATGRRDAGSDPALAAIIANASNYVQQYRPAAGGGTEVVFDGNALEQAITAAGRNVWERERPFTLVVLHPPLNPAGLDDARGD